MTELSLDEVIVNQLKAKVGKHWEICGLTSERGRTLNGLTGECVGYTGPPDLRLHLRVPAEDAVLKVKYSNVIEPDAAAVASENVPCTPTSAEKLKSVAKASLPKALKNVMRERLDTVHRGRRLQESISALEQAGTSLPIKCGEAGPEAERSNDPFMKQLISMKPACVGDGFFRLEHLYALGGHGSSDGQAACRLQEFVPSGFCVSCQIHYMENAGF